MTGIFFRVERNGKWLSLDLAELTTAEATSVLGTFERASLIRTLDHVSSEPVSDEALIKAIIAMVRGLNDARDS